MKSSWTKKNAVAMEMNEETADDQLHHENDAM